MSDPRGNEADQNAPESSNKQVEGTISSPDEFLDKVSFPVELSSLLKVHKFYHYNQKHYYLPVVVSIQDKKLQDMLSKKNAKREIVLQYNYILQVWNKDGDNVYQELLQYEPKVVNVFSNAVLFMKDEREKTVGPDRVVTVLVFETISDQDDKLVVFKKEMPNFFAKNNLPNENQEVKFLGISNGRIYQGTSSKLLYSKDVIPTYELEIQPNNNEGAAVNDQMWLYRKGLCPENIVSLSSKTKFDVYSESNQFKFSSLPKKNNDQHNPQFQVCKSKENQVGLDVQMYQAIDFGGTFKVRALIEHPEESKKGDSLLLFIENGLEVLPICLNANDNTFSYLVEPKIKVNQKEEAKNQPNGSNEDQNMRPAPVILDFQFYILETFDSTKPDEPKTTMFGASLLSDQNVDIYYNYSICDQSTSYNKQKSQDEIKNNKEKYKYDQILITPNEIILKQHVPKVQDNAGLQNNDNEGPTEFLVTRLSFDYISRIGLDVGISDKDPISKKEWEIQKNLFINYYYKQFNQMSFIDTNFIVAFSNIIAFYDLSKNVWSQDLIVLDSQIEYLIRHSKQITPQEEYVSSGQQLLTSVFVVITKSKYLYYLEKVDPSIQNPSANEIANQKQGDNEEQKRQLSKASRVLSNDLSWATYQEQNFQLPGRVLWVSIDKNDDNVQLLGLGTPEGPKVIALTPSSIKTLDSNSLQLKQEDQIIKFMSKNKNERFIVFNVTEKYLKFFEISLPKPDPKKKEDLKVFDGQKITINIQMTKEMKVTQNSIDGGFKEFRMGMKVESLVNDKEKQFVILSTQKHFFIFDYDDPRQVRKIKSLEHEKILMVDQRYFYALLNKNENKPVGLYFLTPDSFIKDQKTEEKDSSVSTFKLRDAACYQCNFLELFKQEARIVYLSDAQTAQIVPILHRNQINFLGMKPRSHYLGFRRINNKLYGLDKNGEFSCWDINNGMIQQKVNTEESKSNPRAIGNQLNKFEVYQSISDEKHNDITYLMDWYPDTLLLKAKQGEEKNDFSAIESYFEKRRTQKVGGVESTEFIKQLNFTMYNFKVIEIFENNQGIPAFREKLSFNHYIPDKQFKKIIQEEEEKYEKKDKNKFQIKQEQDKQKENRYKIEWPQIYINKECDRMIEKFSDNKVFIYAREKPKVGSSNQAGQGNDQQEVQQNEEQKDKSADAMFSLIGKLDDFSHDISVFSYHNYLFNPSLRRYLDYDASRNKYKIVELNVGPVLADTDIYIDVGYMRPSSDQPMNIARKFKWVDDDKFKVINDHGFEILAELVPQSYTRKGLCKYVENSRIKILGQSKIPMMQFAKRIKEKKENIFHYYFDYHYDNDNDEYDLQTTYSRLLRHYQSYFSACYTDNLNVEKLRNSLQTVDFGRNQCREQPVIYQTYSFIHWRLSEVLSKDNDQAINILEDMDIEEAKVLCLNIFPDGSNVLHKICNKLSLVKELYSKIKAYNDEQKSPEDRFYIPFLKAYPTQAQSNDSENVSKSPLHMCLEDKNLQIVDLFLSQLKFDGIDNHSRAIMDILPELFEHELPSLKEYFNSRLQKTGLLSTFKTGLDLKVKKKLDYSQCSGYLWPNMQKIENDICRADQNLREVDNFLEKFSDLPDADAADSRSKDIELKIIDIPNVHDPFSRDGINFFSKLSQVSDIQFFDSPVIQKLIDYQWPQSKKNIRIFLLQNFCIFMLVFVVYSNVLNGQIEYTERVKTARVAFIIIILWLSAGFLMFELYQITRLKLDYFKSFWNFNDILSSSLAIITVAFHLKNYADEEYEIPAIIVTIHSFASLCLWIKFLYFLRVFRPTAYLINAMSQVVWDMKVFLCIFLIVNVGFGEAFLRLSEMREESSFIPNYAYSMIYSFRLSLGDTDTDAFEENLQPVTIWFIFVLCALYTNVVMLNLLIAIISKSFESVSDNETQAHYQERAKMIYENSFLTYISSGISSVRPQAKFVEDKQNGADGASESPLQKPVTYLLDAQYSKSQEEVEEANQEDEKQISLEAFSKAYNTLFKIKFQERDEQNQASKSSDNNNEYENKGKEVPPKLVLESVQSSINTKSAPANISSQFPLQNKGLPSSLHEDTQQIKLQLAQILDLINKNPKITTPSRLSQNNKRSQIEESQSKKTNQLQISQIQVQSKNNGDDQELIQKQNQQSRAIQGV